MAFCLAELHLWSTKSSLQVNDTDIGTYQYYDKGEPAGSLQHHYYNEKKHLCEARGYSWSPRNCRPEKLRDSLKELEDLLLTNTCVHTRWKSKHCCQMVLSTGILLTLSVNGPQLEQVCVDRTLVGRLPANTVTDATLTDRLILLSFLEKNQLCAVYINKKNLNSSDTGRKSEKLSTSEIKVMCVELSGRGQRINRRVALSRQQDVALCWWNQEDSKEELWPWHPTDRDGNNVLLLSCSPSDGLKVLMSIRTEGNPMDCRFSLLQPYQLLTVEVPQQSPTSEGSHVDSCVYDCVHGRLQRLSVIHIPLPSPPNCCSRHPSENMLLLGLKDASLVLHDRHRDVSFLASCVVPPTLLAWHPSGAMVVVGGGQDELMCFDVGLAPFKVTLLSEEVTSVATLQLTQHLRCSGSLQGLQWGFGLDGGLEEAATLMLIFHSGPLGVLRFRFGTLSGGQIGPEQLLQQRLCCGQVQEAVSILETMDFNTAGDQCYRGLSAIINYLLRLPLNAQRENQLEAALAVFYAARTTLCDTVVLEYRDPISKYARRYFHHLLRHQRFEKAFLLAVDLEDRDLFMDLHYVASDKGEVVLADVARRKANEIEAQVVVDLESVSNSEPAPDLGARLTERNRSVPRPSLTARSERKVSLRSQVPENIRVTVSADAFRTLRHLDVADGDKVCAKGDEDPETLRLVNLGTV